MRTACFKLVISVLFLVLAVIGPSAYSQEIPPTQTDHTFFDGMVLVEENDPVAEELKNMLDTWAEHPLSVNSDEVSLLADYKMISLYQFNKLKEYRMMYGDLLTLYELKNVDGWNVDLARKVAPYLTTEKNPSSSILSGPGNTSIRQQVVLKTGTTIEQRKGYQEVKVGDSIAGPYYQGSPFRFSLRYDLEWNDRIEAGFRLEKDPGEPWLVGNEAFSMEYQGFDHLSGYLRYNSRGILRTLVIGDYRMVFGYGLNYSGSSMMPGQQGLAYPSHRLRANTSMSESGFLRGASAYLQKGHFGLTAFYSSTKTDGTSIETDSLGQPESFSSLDLSGIHRSSAEIAQRKQVSEQLFGGNLIFTNNWLKAGLISYYSELNIPARPNDAAYARFRFNGQSNLITGLTVATWLRKIRFAAEVSMSRNGGYAVISGLELIPSDGILVDLLYRHFGKDYQNLHGSGFSGGGNHDNESGIQVQLRLETASRWIFCLMADAASTPWVSYQLNSPSRKWIASLSAERAWRDLGGLYLSARYRKETSKPEGNTGWILHPGYESKWDFRLEGRYAVLKRLIFKTRVEYNLYQATGSLSLSGWLFFQDIGYTALRFPLHFWMRIAFFDSEGYETRLYAYENDVLYDFSSFMHDGKGLRGILLVSYSPWDWLDLWFRITTINYRDRPVISSGWEEVDGEKLEEFDLQIRVKF